MNNKRKEKEHDDILLKRAFEEYCDRMDDSLPTDEEALEAFPPNEEERLYYLDKVKRKERASCAAKILKRVAAIVLAVVSVTFGALMMDENVRAAVTRSVISLVDSSVRVKFTDSRNPGDNKKTSDVTFGYIPEGLAIKELHDDDHPNYRIVQIGEMNDIFDTFVAINVFPSEEVEPGFSESTWKIVYQSTVNGMDAFMIDDESEVDGKPICCRGITFGDEDISIMIFGMNISHEELVKIAENINW